jgi:transcription antitermination factor NusG
MMVEGGEAVVRPFGGEAEAKMSTNFREGTWYAVHTRSRHEKMVASALAGKGFDAYLPLYRARRRWSDRIKELDLPLFPGYVFSRFEITDMLSVLKCAGVARVVAFGQEPAAIDPVELERVQTIVDSGLTVLPWPHLVVGEKVYLAEGPLEGVEGVIARIKGNLRLVVSVTMLQRSVAVEIDHSWVRPLSLKPYL